MTWNVAHSRPTGLSFGCMHFRQILSRLIGVPFPAIRKCGYCRKFARSRFANVVRRVFLGSATIATENANLDHKIVAVNAIKDRTGRGEGGASPHVIASSQR